MNQAIHHKPLSMKIKPLWLREKIFWKFYFNKTTEFINLFENAVLEFAPQVSLKLMPTDIAHKVIAFCGFYELPVSRRLARLAKAGGLMVDVGANYGYYSCIWAAASSRNRVVAFEASPRNISTLNLNLTKNKLEMQVDVHVLAVGKDSGSLFFTIGSEEQTGWGGLALKNQTGSVEVSVVSLDDFFQDNSEHIDVLKIDTEGADTWVIKGAKKLLQSKKINHIFFEENFVRMSDLGIKLGEAQKFLQNYGYYVKKIGINEWYAMII